MKDLGHPAKSLYQNELNLEDEIIATEEDYHTIHVNLRHLIGLDLIQLDLIPLSTTNPRPLGTDMASVWELFPFPSHFSRLYCFSN